MPPISKETYLVTPPIKDRVILGVVGHRVAVSGADIRHGHVQCSIHPHRHVFLALAAQSSVVIAPPRVEHAVRSQGYCVHPSAGHLDDRLGRQIWAAELENLQSSWFLYFAWCIVAKA